METTVITCKNCGNLFTGKYCNECGEKVYTEHDKKLSHVFEEAFHFITHLDSKFLKSLKYLFSKPGFISKEYCEGKRKKYFKPVSLFLIGVVIYLLFPLLQGLNISFESHLANNNIMHLFYSRTWAVHKMSTHHWTEQQLAEKFDHLSSKFAKVLLFVMLPLTTISLSFIFRKKHRYFFDHFILTTEINTLFLFLFFMVLDLILLAGAIPLFFVILNTVFHTGLDFGDSSLLYSGTQIILIFFVLIASFKRFYSVSFVKAFLASLLYILNYAIALFIYRQLVFILVMLFL